MDRLFYEMVKVRTDCAYFMNGKLKRKFMALCRSTFGAVPEVALMMLGVDGKPFTMNVPVWNGCPIFQVDDIPSNEVKSVSTLSSVYLASLTPGEGFYCGVQQAPMGQMADLDPYAARIAGVQLYEVGQRETTGANRTRIEWFGAFALGSELAAARASELITV